MTVDQPPSARRASARSTNAYRRTFAAVYEFPAFRRLWFAVLGSSLGQWVQGTAIGWLAFDLTDSKSFVGFVAFASGLPFLVVSLPAGIVIDRFDRRRVLMTCQGLAALLATLVAIDVIAGWVEPWHLLVAGFCNGSLQAMLNPSQQSIVPRLVDRASLTNAIGLMGAGVNMTRVVGPSLAGAIIGLAGTGEAFLLQAVALLAAFASIATGRFPSRGAPALVPGRARLLDGIALVARRPDLRAIFLLAAIPTLFIFPYISFLAVYARDVLGIGPGGLGLLMASSGVGAVAGSLLVASTRGAAPSGRRLIALTIAYCGVIALFAASTTLWISLPVLVVAGLIGSYFFSANNALIQHRITDDVRGRVTSTYMLTWGLMPLGSLPMGFLAQQSGIRAATVCGAALCVAFTALLAARSPALRDL